MTDVDHNKLEQKRLHRREYMRRWRDRNRLRYREIARRYNAAHPNHVKLWLAKQKEDPRSSYYAADKSRHPGRVKARLLLNAAIRRGRINRQPCEVCGSSPAHAHHDDYRKPYDVKWLCPGHHYAHHVARRVPVIPQASLVA